MNKKIVLLFLCTLMGYGFCFSQNPVLKNIYNYCYNGKLVGLGTYSNEICVTKIQIEDISKMTDDYKACLRFSSNSSLYNLAKKINELESKVRKIDELNRKVEYQEKQIYDLQRKINDLERKIR